MGHTNATVNYNLPQFVGTDKPSWLGDVNGAFLAIDTAIAAAKTEADSAAGGVAGLQVTVGGHTTQIGALSDAVTSQGGTLNSVTSLIGNGTPTTTDQTIIGAINELNERKYKLVQKSGTAGTVGDKLAVLKTAYDALPDAQKSNAYILGSSYGKSKYSNHNLSGIFISVTLSATEMRHQVIDLTSSEMHNATTTYGTGVTTWSDITSVSDTNELSLVLA